MSMLSEHGRRAALLGVSVLCGAVLAACNDPGQDRAIAALGPESDDGEPGPLHRPGHPCLICHGGATARGFSLAGSGFWTAESDLPAPGTEVRVIDSAERRFTALTNCAGSFFVRPEEFEPVYPLWVMLRNGTAEIEMDSPVRADGSCAGCHALT